MYERFPDLFEAFGKPSASLREGSKVKARDKEKEKVKEQEKEPYGEYVRLTKDEHRKLTERYGAASVKKMIDKLNNAIGSKGYKYKSHYRAILNWVVEAVGAQEVRAGPEWKCPECGAVHHSTYKVCECGWGR